mgnify:FL=1
MAERRMFAKSIIDTDAFLDMPASSQNLYFHLAMRADDDGFVDNPRKIQRIVGASDDDLRILIGKRYILAFDSGVIVIKHWRLHNYIRKDRYTPTLYEEEKNSLYLKENGAYTDHPVEPPEMPEQTVENTPETASENSMATIGQPMVTHLATQDRLGKDRLVEGRIEGSSSLRSEEPKKVKKKSSAAFVPPTLEEVAAYARERNSSVDPKKFFEYFNTPNDKGQTWIDSKGNPVRNWKQKFLTWEGRDGGRKEQGNGRTGGSGGTPKRSYGIVYDN